MPFYRDIKEDTKAGKRTLNKLLDLRKALKVEIPERKLSETLLLATWNIRDFDKPAYGERLDEAFYYIAEIISHFDLVALQEIYKDLSGLERVMKILGSNWKCLFTDETAGWSGNDERLAFVYDTRKVKFGGLASELVLPPVKDEEGNLRPAIQFSRTPFMVGFSSGWCKFILATVHILWGKDEAESAERVREIREVAQFIKERSFDEASWARNIILLGDFNIFNTEDSTFKQLKDAGFEVPKALMEFCSNVKGNRHYDQIAFRTRADSLASTGNVGVFDYCDYVFRDTKEDRNIYAPFMRKTIKDSNSKKSPSKKSKEYDERTEDGKRLYYRTYWRTQQMSDHLPMWVELQVDYSDEYLKYKLDKGAS
jgi:endonuclease/exonuclease/phosphatase family metal-dependent hydrolase